MAGKSTLMRQVALIAILAQVGSYVPAQKAELPIFTEVFTRIGASDALNEGLSTFMVEMSETARILSQVQPQSLVILDEIGRGTSTYDGLSLAQAILEHLVGIKRPYLLFATHYHELAKLSEVYPQVFNAHMTVRESGGNIRFLHTLKMGPANRSYGIHVAKIAGIPASVTTRAESLLGNFEGKDGGQLALFAQYSEPNGGGAMELEPTASLKPPPTFLEDLKKLDLGQLTPIEALNKLFEWQREVSS
jgi:DNA mismatch repair protein MutS